MIKVITNEECRVTNKCVVADLNIRNSTFVHRNFIVALSAESL